MPGRKIKHKDLKRMDLSFSFNVTVKIHFLRGHAPLM